jgi:NADPH-dependent curcumin reductase CurA
MVDKRLGHEIHLKQRPVGFPTEDNFEFVRVSVPAPREGEFLVRNIWMSVDPYMRGRMRETKGHLPSFQLNKPLEGACVGQVIESKNNQFKVGEYLLSNFGWREYWLSVDGSGITKVDPNMAPIQSYLGVLGMTGFTAYVGLLKVGQLKENKDDNTVFVSAASGAVGSVACQIAKIMGCRVVGSTGSLKKVNWLLDQARIDHAFNYKEIGEDNISFELRKFCPNGIHVYFDNVGGKHLEAALDNMEMFGKIVLCGMISQYNLPASQQSGPSNLFLAITNRLNIQGFIVRDHYHMLNEFYTNMSKWISQEKIKWQETVVEGLENAPKAFIALFKGEHMGKMLVKIF